MMRLLADTTPKLEDVFKSTQTSFENTGHGNQVWALVLGAIAIVLLLVLFQKRGQRRTLPRSANHHGKLLKEIQRQLPLKNREIKQLKILADQEGCSSPLVLLLCPSLLTRAIHGKNNRVDRKIIADIARKLTRTG